MEGLSEEFEFELEALRATYDDDAVQVEPAGSAARGSSGGCGSPPVAVVSLPVAPRCEAEHGQFVAGRLVMAVGAGYPAEPPAVQLADAKGLGDARLAGIQSALAVEAAAMAGELQLGHLCETALDLLTDANQPEGDCAFCLEPLLHPDDSRGGNGAAPSVLRLACYHCYHTACFAPWWQWQQRRSGEREAQLWSEYKSMAPLKLEEEGIRREPLSWLPAGAGGSGSGSVLVDGAAHGMGGGAVGEEQAEEGDERGSRGSSKGPAEAYVLLCPACRADIVPSSLAHTWPQLQAATAESWSSGAQGASASGRASLAFLPPQQQQALLAMQQRHAAVMRRQQACGGIVEASHSVSISDLQQAAAAAAAAEAAAAEAAALAAAQQAQQAQGGAAGRGRGGRGRGRGGPHLSGGRGPPPRFPGSQQREGDGDGSSRHDRSSRGRAGRGRGGGRGGRHSDVPAAGGDSLAAAEGALAGMRLGDTPQHAPQQQQAQQQQQQHGGRRPGGGRGGRGGRHGRGGGGRGRESAASASAAAAPATS